MQHRSSSANSWWVKTSTKCLSNGQQTIKFNLNHLRKPKFSLGDYVKATRYSKFCWVLQLFTVSCLRLLWFSTLMDPLAEFTDWSSRWSSSASMLVGALMKSGLKIRWTLVSTTTRSKTDWHEKWKVSHLITFWGQWKSDSKQLQFRTEIYQTFADTGLPKHMPVIQPEGTCLVEQCAYQRATSNNLLDKQLQLPKTVFGATNVLRHIKGSTNLEALGSES